MYVILQFTNTGWEAKGTKKTREGALNTMCTIARAWGNKHGYSRLFTPNALKDAIAITCPNDYSSIFCIHRVSDYKLVFDDKLFSSSIDLLKEKCTDILAEMTIKPLTNDAMFHFTANRFNAIPNRYT